MTKTQKIPYGYLVVPSSLGEVGILWQETEDTPVQQILLPRPEGQAQVTLQQRYPTARPAFSPAVQVLGEQIQAFLSGEDVRFDLTLLALQRCSDFQQRVLRAEFAIPRGWVSSYGRIAAHLGVTGGARAVGGALAHNPFPLVIPCHRAIGSGGELGGFQGGLEMKKALLMLEGVAFTATGRVLVEKLYY